MRTRLSEMEQIADWFGIIHEGSMLVIHEDMPEGRRNTTVEIHFNFMKQESRLTVKS